MAVTRGDHFRYRRVSLVLSAITITLKFTTGSHICDRNCVKGEAAMTCRYNWTMEKFVTLSKNCFDCPLNIDDCYREECIAANGVRRSITVLNRKMPGEPIVVCKGDRVVVDVHNKAGTDATTIHWHGQKQVGTPYMDGVPFVTQCPILPFDKFRYIFKAADAGTFFYHGHFGFQRLDGINGMLIVRQPKEDDPNRALYDHDLTDHHLMITDWTNITGGDLYNRVYFTVTDYAGYLTSLLVNGHGRLAGFLNATTGTTHYTPYTSFTVRQGSRYRFRICSAAGWICPIEFSVDKHNLTVLGTDGDSVEPMTVNAIVVNPGERFDFVIDANQDINTYWMTFRGLFRCEVENAMGKAILKYETAIDVEPPESSMGNSTSPIRILNPVNDPFTNVNHISLGQLKSFTPMDPVLKEKPDVKWYIPFDLYRNNDPSYYDPVYYDFILLLPEVNHTAFLYPPSPLLSQYDDIPEDILCTDKDLPKNCSDKFCHCTYYLKAKLGAVVELIMIDIGQTGRGANHPWHIHGHSFLVLGQSLLYDNNTVEYVKAMDDAGEIKRNFDKPVLKDTVSVPNRGYTVLRFLASNPGFWAFHCHVEMHAEAGMILVFQVGELHEMAKTPRRFPRCGNYLPPV